MCSYILDQNLLLTAKSTTNTRFDHANPLRRQVQYRCKLTTDMEGHLCARADHQAIIFIPVGHHNMRFYVCLLHLGYFVGRFDDFIGCLKTLFDITDIDVDLGGKVT